MAGEENKAIVRRWVAEAWNDGDFSSAADLYPPEYVLHFGSGPAQHGSEGLVGFIQAYRSAFPDLRMTIEDLIAAGDKVVWRIVTSGTQQGELMGIPPSGQFMSVGAIVISRFAGGQWVEDWVNNDDLGLLQQIGAIPAPAGAAV
jgi:steroid delta-isomerase-like uncharacterized protein